MLRTSIRGGACSVIALSAFFAFSLAAPASAGTVDLGGNTTKTLNNGDDGVLANGQTLSTSDNPAINWATGSITVTNAGLIEQLNTGRAFDTSGSGSGRNLKFDNLQGGIIRSFGQDAFRINTNISSGSVLIDNAGVIRAQGTGFAPLGQAVDLRSLNTSGVSVQLFNRSTGVIEALSDDALRPGRDMQIFNAGIIRSFGANTSGGADGTSDAIDVGGRAGVVVTNQSGGLISGARHGITADNDVTVTNQVNATIIGRNGSGVGSDGNGTVTNYGTITGAYAGLGNIINSSGNASANGDGDGVDIDHIGTVKNYGVIQGTGAGGVDSGGNPNGSEGIAMGGGSIFNYAGALISGASRGILVDDGADGAPDALVKIENAGTIQGLAGAAIKIVGPYANEITNSGLIKGAGAEATIIMGSGDDTLTNSGTINGSVDLGGGANIFDNLAGGRLNAGTLLTPGTGRMLDNAGTIAPGGDGTIITTTLTGSLNQTATGSLSIDIDTLTNDSDRIEVSEQATLAGNVTLWVTKIAIASDTVTVLTGNDVNHDQLGLIASPALQAKLLNLDAKKVQVAYSVNFAPTAVGLNDNQNALGGYLNNAVIANSASIDPVARALLSVTSNGAYTAALDQLSPELYGDTAVSTLYGTHTFGNALLSCHPREGAYAAVSEDQCVWADISGRDYQQDRTSAGIGYDEQTWGLSGGAQVSVGKDLKLGFAGGFEEGSSDTTSGASADIDRVYGGVSLKHTSGPWLLAAAVYGGQAWADTSRLVNFGGLAMVAHGKQDIEHLSGRVRAAYQAGSNALYAKPMVDLEATQLWLGSVQETGGPAALSIAGSNETVFSAAPAVEIGGEAAIGGGVLLRPFVRAGAIFYSNDDIAISSVFASVPAGVPAFQTTAEIERVMGTVGAGLEFVWSDASTVKLHYDGMFGEETQQHAFGAKASLKF